MRSERACRHGEYESIESWSWRGLLPEPLEQLPPTIKRTGTLERRGEMAEPDEAQLVPLTLGALHDPRARDRNVSWIAGRLAHLVRNHEHGCPQRPSMGTRTAGRALLDEQLKSTTCKALTLAEERAADQALHKTLSALVARCPAADGASSALPFASREHREHHSFTRQLHRDPLLFNTPHPGP